MPFPPTVGTRYQTQEGRIWVVASFDDDGVAREARMTTEGRDNIAEQVVLEEEWTAFEASVRPAT